MRRVTEAGYPPHGGSEIVALWHTFPTSVRQKNVFDKLITRHTFTLYCWLLLACQATVTQVDAADCKSDIEVTATGTASNKKRAQKNALAKLDNLLKAGTPPIVRQGKAKMSCEKSWWWRCEAHYKKCANNDIAQY